MTDLIKHRNEVNKYLNKTEPKDSPKSLSENDKQYKWEFVWYRAIGLPAMHILALSGVFLVLKERYVALSFYTIFMGLISGIGTTAGAHRLWTHRSYKAKFPLRVLLMIFQTMSYQRSLMVWCRDHRSHHKFTDTDADPHNSTRGFFYSHIGWIMMKKHPDVTVKGKIVDMSDLEADPIVTFQDKFYYVLMPIFGFVIPAFIPYYFFNYDYVHTFLICSVLRWIYVLNAAFFVNSAAHLWGPKPYEKSITSCESPLVIAMAIGEGYHNYHHVFPWDYKAAELGGYYTNISKYFIELCAKLGWAYDLRTVSEETLKKRILRTGDGTHPEVLDNMKLNELMDQLDLDQVKDKELIWGWNDKDMKEEFKKSAKIIYQGGF